MLEVVATLNLVFPQLVDSVARVAAAPVYGVLDEVAKLMFAFLRIVESDARDIATPVDGVLVEAATLIVVFLPLVDAETLALALAVATVSFSFLPTSNSAKSLIALVYHLDFRRVFLTVKLRCTRTEQGKSVTTSWFCKRLMSEQSWDTQFTKKRYMIEPIALCIYAVL